MIVIDVDRTDLEQRLSASFLSSLSIAAKAAMVSEAEATRGRITDGRYWTNRTTKTAKSFKVTPELEGLGVTVRSGAKVARFLNDGTRPHLITGSPLRFLSGSGVVFARRVQHPGTRARHFVETEAAAAEPRTAAAVESAIEQAISRAGLG